MMHESGLAVGVSIVVARAREMVTPEMSTEAKALLCYRLARDNGCTWFTSTEEERFRIGTGALLVLSKDDDETKRRVTQSMRMLQAVSAAISGIPVDFEGLGEPEDMLPLTGWWQQSAVPS